MASYRLKHRWLLRVVWLLLIDRLPLMTLAWIGTASRYQKHFVSEKAGRVSSPLSRSGQLPTSLGSSHDPENLPDMMEGHRRTLLTKRLSQAVLLGVGATILAGATRPVWATSRSRTDAYAVQKPEAQWRRELSPIQYYVLREGGTERPGFSILEAEKREGVYTCAGCGTELFRSVDKFKSGTGWPSFARALPGVEVEDVGFLMANLSGAELRCRTCGGHLGDVFQDGFLFVGTEAAKTGKRYCIDGAALIFNPANTGDNAIVRGDQSAM